MAFDDGYKTTPADPGEKGPDGNRVVSHVVGPDNKVKFVTTVSAMPDLTGSGDAPLTYSVFNADTKKLDEDRTRAAQQDYVNGLTDGYLYVAEKVIDVPVNFAKSVYQAGVGVATAQLPPVSPEAKAAEAPGNQINYQISESGAVIVEVTDNKGRALPKETQAMQNDMAASIGRFARTGPSWFGSDYVLGTGSWILHGDFLPGHQTTLGQHIGLEQQKTVDASKYLDGALSNFIGAAASVYGLAKNFLNPANYRSGVVSAGVETTETGTVQAARTATAPADTGTAAATPKGTAASSAPAAPVAIDEVNGVTRVNGMDPAHLTLAEVAGGAEHLLNEKLASIRIQLKRLYPDHYVAKPAMSRELPPKPVTVSASTTPVPPVTAAMPGAMRVPDPQLLKQFPHLYWRQTSVSRAGELPVSRSQNGPWSRASTPDASLPVTPSEVESPVAPHTPTGETPQPPPAAEAPTTAAPSPVTPAATVAAHTRLSDRFLNAWKDISANKVKIAENNRLAKEAELEKTRIEAQQKAGTAPNPGTAPQSQPRSLWDRLRGRNGRGATPTDYVRSSFQWFDRMIARNTRRHNYGYAEGGTLWRFGAGAGRSAVGARTPSSYIGNSWWRGQQVAKMNVAGKLGSAASFISPVGMGVRVLRNAASILLRTTASILGKLKKMAIAGTVVGVGGYYAAKHSGSDIAKEGAEWVKAGADYVGGSAADFVGQRERYDRATTALGNFGSGVESRVEKVVANPSVKTALVTVGNDAIALWNWGRSKAPDSWTGWIPQFSLIKAAEASTGNAGTTPAPQPKPTPPPAAVAPPPAHPAPKPEDIDTDDHNPNAIPPAKPVQVAAVPPSTAPVAAAAVPPAAVAQTPAAPATTPAAPAAPAAAASTAPTTPKTEKPAAKSRSRLKSSQSEGTDRPYAPGEQEDAETLALNTAELNRIQSGASAQAPAARADSRPNLQVAISSPAVTVAPPPANYPPANFNNTSHPYYGDMKAQLNSDQAAAYGVTPDAKGVAVMDFTKMTDAQKKTYAIRNYVPGARGGNG